MNLRYYTEDDYVNAVPCIFKHGDTCETVQAVGISGRQPFDGSRLLTFKWAKGYVATRTIGGSDLKQVIFALNNN